MHLQQLKGIQRGQNWVCERGERGTTCQWRVCEKDAFTVQKMIYERVRGWISGQSLPVQNFVEYPPPGDYCEMDMDSSFSGDVYASTASFIRTLPLIQTPVKLGFLIRSDN